MKTLRSSWLLLVGFGAYFFSYGPYWSAHWYSKWAFLMGAFSIGISFWAAKRIHWLVFFPACYFLLNAGALGIWGPNTYVDKLDSVSLLALEHNALYSYLAIVASLLFLSLIDMRKVLWRPFFIGMGGLYLFQMVLAAPGRPVLDGQNFGNPSMGACLLLAILPIFWETLNRFNKTTRVLGWLASWWLVAFMIYRTETSIPIGLLALVTGAYLLRTFKNKWAVIWAGIILADLAMAGQFFLGKELLQDNGRYTIWQEVYQWWNGTLALDPRKVLGLPDLFFQWHPSQWFGAGLGSTSVLVPVVQTGLHGAPKDFFIWLHNDWLQILFETGWVGLGLSGVVWLWLLVRSYRSADLFSSLIGFSAMAVFNYPLRLPLHAFSLLILCAVIIGQRECAPESSQVSSPNRKRRA